MTGEVPLGPPRLPRPEPSPASRGWGKGLAWGCGGLSVLGGLVALGAMLFFVIRGARPPMGSATRPESRPESGSTTAVRDRVAAAPIPTPWDAHATLVLTDAFNQRYLPDEASASEAMYYQRGTYHLVLHEADRLLAALYAEHPYPQVYLQVAARWVSSDTPSDGSLGFVCGFRSDDAGDTYITLEVGLDGFAGVWYYQDDTLLDGDWRPLPESLTQALQRGDWVVLNGLCTSQHVVLYLNGQVIYEDLAPWVEPDGAPGLLIATFDEPELHVAFDDFRLWSLR
ncbi:MAG: hypothetical protein GXO36_03845 [Chloroflexi bacterium]|nr:hypothetical protein [Chloroflexota bacterium]